jgi:hypothetical protein
VVASGDADAVAVVAATTPKAARATAINERCLRIFVPNLACDGYLRPVTEGTP